MSLQSQYKKQVAETTSKTVLLDLFKKYVQFYCINAVKELEDDQKRNAITNFLASRDKKNVLLSTLFCKIIAESKGTTIVSVFDSYLERYRQEHQNAEPIDAIQKFIDGFDIVLSDDGQSTQIISIASDDEKDFVAEIEKVMFNDDDELSADFDLGGEA